jgi:hypothetical protein
VRDAFTPGRLQGAGTPFEWPEATGFGRAPFAAYIAGPGGVVAGPDGVALGIFGWVDPASLQVSNLFTSGFQLGFVLPVFNGWNWQRVYRQCPPVPCSGAPTLWILRPGLGCVIAVQGDFLTQFPEGAQAGAQVFADPATGLPYTSNPGGYIATPWTAMQGAGCNCSARISSFAAPVN